MLVTVNGSIISSIYPITLDSYSQTLQQVYYPFALTYFEAVEIVVSVTGNYTIGSLGNIDTIGYLYENNINLDFMWLNLLQTDFWGMDIYSFLITSTLQASYKYVLLATTLEGPLTGSFQIQVSGPGTVNFTTVIVSSKLNENSTFISDFILCRFVQSESRRVIIFISFNKSKSHILPVNCTL